MKGLFLKDLCILKLQARFFMMLLMIAVIIVATGSEVTFLMSYLMFVFAIFTLSTMAYDDLDNGMNYLLTLPVTRGQYVLSKYIFGLFMIGLAGVASAIVILIVLSMNAEVVNMQEIIFTCAVIVGIVLLFLGVTFPIHFKYGAEKGKIVMFIVFAIIVMPFAAIEKLLEDKGIALEQLLSVDLRVETVIMAIVGIGVIVYGLSILISKKIMENKEF